MTSGDDQGTLLPADPPTPPSLHAQARAIAGAWLTYQADKTGAPVPNRNSKVHQLAKAYIRPALEVGYTEDQVKRALLVCDVWVPTLPGWQSALVGRGGAYSNAAMWGTDPTTGTTPGDRELFVANMVRMGRSREQAEAEWERVGA